MKFMLIIETKFGIFSGILEICSEMLSYMIANCMENHLRSDSDCNVVLLQCRVLFTRTTINVWFAFSVNLHEQFTMSIEPGTLNW